MTSSNFVSLIDYISFVLVSWCWLPLINKLLFRLILASFSPMLATLMLQTNCEDDQVIFVEGADLETLNQIVHILYIGRDCMI